MHIEDLQAEAAAKTRQLLGIAEQRFNLASSQPAILFNLKGKAAGLVVFQKHGRCKIRYNRSLLARYGRLFIEQTVPHEVAHLIARARHGAHIKPHGDEWKAVMKFFHAAPRRCHSFDTSDSATRTMRYFDYRCDCRTHRISAIRHNRMLSGTTYLCRVCGSSLVSSEKTNQRSDAASGQASSV